MLDGAAEPLGLLACEFLHTGVVSVVHVVVNRIGGGAANLVCGTAIGLCLLGGSVTDEVLHAGNTPILLVRAPALYWPGELEQEQTDAALKSGTV